MTHLFTFQIRRALENIRSMTITTDGGSSLRVRKYQAITGHWISEDWKMCGVVLDLVLLNESCTGEHLAAFLRSSLQCVLLNMMDSLFY